MSQQVSQKDVYLDKDGNPTEDATKAVQQVAFKGSVISQNARHKFNLEEDGSFESKKSKEKAAEPSVDDKKSKTLRTDSIARVSTKSAK